MAVEGSVESKIVAVQVFMDRAQVRRMATVPLHKGEQALTFDMLPPNAQRKSLQVAVGGPLAQDVVLKGVLFHKEHLARDPEPIRADLSTQLEQLQDQIRDASDVMLERERLRKLSYELAARFTQPLKEDSHPPREVVGSLVDVLAFSRESSAALLTEQREAERNLRNLQKEEGRLRAKLRQVERGGGTSRENIRVMVESSKDGNINLFLDYVVTNARWEPVYDVRVIAEEKKVDLAYHGMVSQSTGEDWDGVEVTLSTAQPQLGGKQPELETWRIGQQREVISSHILMCHVCGGKQEATLSRGRRRAPQAPPQMMMQQMMVPTANIMAMEGLEEEDDMLADAEDVPTMMRTREARVAAKGTSAVFSVAGTHSIKPNNDPVKVTIMQQRFGAYFRHSCVPKADAHCFLKANITNGSECPFLPGEASIFLDGNFVATSKMDLVAPAEDFWVFLGVDEGVGVKHKTVRQKTRLHGGMLSRKTTVVEFETLIELRNNRQDEIEIVTFDQLPISEHADVIVTMDETPFRVEGVVMKKNELQVVEWMHHIPPAGRVSIPFKFTVEHPREMRMYGM